MVSKPTSKKSKGTGKKSADAARPRRHKAAEPEATEVKEAARTEGSAPATKGRRRRPAAEGKAGKPRGERKSARGRAAKAEAVAAEAVTVEPQVVDAQAAPEVAARPERRTPPPRLSGPTQVAEEDGAIVIRFPPVAPPPFEAPPRPAKPEAPAPVARVVPLAPEPEEPPHAPAPPPPPPVRAVEPEPQPEFDFPETESEDEARGWEPDEGFSLTETVDTPPAPRSQPAESFQYEPGMSASKKRRMRRRRRRGPQDGAPQQPATTQPGGKPQGAPHGQREGQHEAQREGPHEGRRDGQRDGQRGGQREGQREARRDGRRDGRRDAQRPQSGPRPGGPQGRPTPPRAPAPPPQDRPVPQDLDDEIPLPPAESAIHPEIVSDDPTPWFEAADSIRAQVGRPADETEILGEEEVMSGAAPVEPVDIDDVELDLTEGAEPDTEAPTSELRQREGGERGRDEDRGRQGRRRRRRGGRRSRHEAIEIGPDAEPEPVGAPRTEGVPATTKSGGPVREMIINAIPREECRIAILAGGRLEEIYLERATAENHVGNIYKGVVTNVEPSIQAAFIDFGQGKNGFLHISDLHPQYFPDGQGATENVGHKMPRRSRPPIQRCLRRGQEMIVQVTKEGIGTKGPTLSTYLSIPGRFLVMMPGMGRLGVSRRIEDDDSRDKLRNVLAELELPEGMGFIARTAALDRTKKELQSDLTYLTRLWRAVETRVKNDPAPAELYRESDLVIRTIRDVFTSDVERILVDDQDVAARARDFLSIFSPRSNDIVNVYADAVPLFHKYGIEAELERLHSRRVPLKSGGSLVIDPTEALVAIDVNSGRFRTEDDAEATAYKINIEAADEIARQLRLRDLGGVVVCDFIDMRMESHRRDIERRLARNLKDHKERAKVLRMSEFGIIELTRQRQRASLTRSVYQDCRHCRGTGLVKTIESVALDVMRMVQLAVSKEHIFQIEVVVSPDVAYLLQNRKRRLLHELESKNRRIISIKPDPAFCLDQVEIRCTDSRGRLVPHM